MAKRSKEPTMEQPTQEQSRVLEQKESMQIIVFKVGEQEYALHIDQIKEVVLTPTVTPMPEVADYVKGVANVRGNIISIVDLSKRFGIKTDDDEELGKYLLVIESEEYKMGVLVKTVPNTLNIPVSSIEDAQNVIGEAGAHYIKGIVKMQNRLIILIDIFKVLENTETGNR